MSLNDPFFTKFDGSPDLGKVPVRLVVGGSGRLSADQLRDVEQVYQQFRTACRLSVSNFHSEQVRLGDGTRVWLWSLQGRDEVTAWPSDEFQDDEQQISAVAYSSGLDLRYLPIYDRTVIDHADEIIPLLEYPPEPEYPPPPQYPEGPMFHLGFGEIESHKIVATGEYPDTVYSQVPTTESERSHVYYLTSESATAIQHFRTREPPGATGAPGHVTEESVFHNTAAVYGPFDDPVNSSFPQGLRGGVPASEENIAAYLAEHPDTPNPELWGRAYIYHAVWTKSLVWMEDEYASGGGYWVNSWTASESYDTSPDSTYRSDWASWASGLAAAQAAWQAEVDQLRNPWLAACAAIDVQNAAIEAANDVIRNTVFPGITSTRIAGRAAQISAIRSMLSGGIGLPTLTARILSFPYSVGFTAAGDAGVPPDFYEFPPPYGEGAVPFSGTWPSSPTSSQNFGTHLCDPYCIFGWTASGSVSRGVMWPGGPETGEIKGLNESAFWPRSGYAEFVDAGLTSYQGTDGRMNSDAFVPPGTTITTVFLEYECFDEYTGEWVWTPSVRTISEDSIWIKSLGGYRDQERQQPEQWSPRSMRTWKAIRQTRAADWGWSTPEQVVDGEENGLPWGGDVPPYWTYDSGGEGGSGDGYPSMVVIAENLPKESMPIQGGDFGAGNVVWSGMDSYDELFSRVWDGYGSLEDLIMNVMKALLGGQEP